MIATNPVVFLVDDDPAIRNAVSPALRRRGMEVHALASASDFLTEYSNTPGCLVLDLGLPGMSGLELQDELIKRKLTIPIVFITGHGDIQQSVQALRAGAINFLEKPFLLETLIQSIEEALAKDVETRNSSQRRAEILSRFSRLTLRECDVLRLLHDTENIPSSKEIARVLKISHRTVEYYRSRLLDKTKTKSIPELSSLAKEVGFVLPAPGEDPE